MLNDVHYRDTLFNIKGMRIKEARVLEQIELRHFRNNLTGDIDILVVPANQPELSTAIQVKRFKAVVTRDEQGVDDAEVGHPKRFQELMAKGVQQANFAARLPRHFEVLQRVVFGDFSPFELTGHVATQHVVQLALELDRECLLWPREEDASESPPVRDQNRRVGTQNPERQASLNSRARSCSSTTKTSTRRRASSARNSARLMPAVSAARAIEIALC